MSIFDAGFIVWGYFLFYVALTLAYFGWMAARNRKDARRGAGDAALRYRREGK